MENRTPFGHKSRSSIATETLPDAGNLRDLLETLLPGGLPLNPNRNGLKTFIAQIPKNHILILGKILGHLLYYLAARHRRIVRRNLQFSHIVSSPQQLQNLSKRIFRHFGITILELLQMMCFSQKELIRNIQIEGIEILIEALARQKGVVMIYLLAFDSGRPRHHRGFYGSRA